jgi:hypothetical protein
MTLPENYKQIFNDFCIGLKQIEILCSVATYTLEDFPNNLPENLGRSVTLAIGEISKQLNYDENNSNPQVIDVEVLLNSELEKQLALSVLEFLMMKPVKMINRITDYNFERIICPQSLIIVFAHFEAFMVDTIKFICETRPEVLKSKSKKISFEDALEFENNIKQFLTDQYTNEFNWKSVEDKLNFFKSEFGIKLDIEDSNLEALVNAENIRHIVVHNGGRMSQQFINKSKKKDFKIGDLVYFSFKEIINISKLTHYIASKIYVETIRKFVKDFDKHNFNGAYIQWQDIIEELDKD